MKKLLTVLSSKPSCCEMVICISLDGRLFSLKMAIRVRRWRSVKTSRCFLGCRLLSFCCSCSLRLQARCSKERTGPLIGAHHPGPLAGLPGCLPKTRPFPPVNLLACCPPVPRLPPSSSSLGLLSVCRDGTTASYDISTRKAWVKLITSSDAQEKAQVSASPAEPGTTDQGKPWADSAPTAWLLGPASSLNFGGHQSASLPCCMLAWSPSPPHHLCGSRGTGVSWPSHPAASSEMQAGAGDRDVTERPVCGHHVPRQTAWKDHSWFHLLWEGVFLPPEAAEQPEPPEAPGNSVSPVRLCYWILWHVCQVEPAPN